MFSSAGPVGYPVARVERQRNPGAALPFARAFPHFVEPVIGPAHRVRPLAGPMASSGGTRWLNAGYGATPTFSDVAGDDGALSTCTLSALPCTRASACV